MSDEHSAAKMVAGAAAVAMAFFAVGTPEDPNAPRLANRSDWERCLKHPIHPVRASGRPDQGGELRPQLDGRGAGRHHLGPHRLLLADLGPAVPC